MSRATKATGNNPDWYNVIHDHPETEKVKSKYRIKRLVLSSLSVETLALCDALDDAIFLQQMISEFINKTFSRTIDVYTNNRSLYILNSTNAVSEKRLCADIAMIQENI